MKKKLLSWLLVLVAVMSLAGGQVGYTEASVTGVFVNATDSVKVKEAKEAFNKAHFSAIAAAACLGSYDPKNSVEFAYLHDYGWQVMPFSVIDKKVEANFVVARNKVIDDKINMYLVAVRGSSSLKDWKENFSVKLVPYGGNDLLSFADYAKKDLVGENVAKVHSGFNSYTQAMLDTMVDFNGSGKLENKFFEDLKNNPNTFLLLTGHSLGGAVATLLGERLVSWGMPKDKLAVITFGAPAIGNKAFAQQYGDKIHLLRYTITADPIPSSIQSALHKYVQFGEEDKFHLSPKLSNMQHSIDIYFDRSMGNYFKAYDAAVAAGVKQPLPEEEIRDKTKPLVAVWVGSSREIEKRGYVPDVKRFLEAEYRMMLPNYVFVNHNWDPNSEDKTGFFQRAKALKADYVLAADIDGRPVRNTNDWYMNLEQSMWNVPQNQLITMDSIARRVSPVSGNMSAAIYAVRKGREEMHARLPWIVTDFSH